MIIGANIVGIPLLVSSDKDFGLDCVMDICASVGLKADFIKEDATDFALKIPQIERVRYHAKPNREDIIYKNASANAKIIIATKPLINGRFELLYYHNEKSLSISYHRYGNLGIRGIKSTESKI